MDNKRVLFMYIVEKYERFFPGKELYYNFWNKKLTH